MVYAWSLSPVSIATSASSAASGSVSRGFLLKRLRFTLARRPAPGVKSIRVGSKATFSVGLATRASCPRQASAAQRRAATLRLLPRCSPARTSCAVVRANGSHPVRLPDSRPKLLESIATLLVASRFAIPHASTRLLPTLAGPRGFLLKHPQYKLAPPHRSRVKDIRVGSKAHLYVASRRVRRRCMNIASRSGWYVAASMSAVGEGIAFDDACSDYLGHGRTNGFFGGLSSLC
jgi:hypothetical protein